MLRLPHLRSACSAPVAPLRYRLYSSRPFASAPTAAGRGRQAGPLCPFSGDGAPPSLAQPRSGGSGALVLPWGCAGGRHGGTPLLRLRIAPLCGRCDRLSGRASSDRSHAAPSSAPLASALSPWPRCGLVCVSPGRGLSGRVGALRLGRAARRGGAVLRSSLRAIPLPLGREHSADITDWFIPRFPCLSRSGPRASLRRRS